MLGDRDVAQITEIGHLLGNHIPGARLVTFAGADHLLPLRVPEELDAVLLEHLARA